MCSFNSVTSLLAIADCPHDGASYGTARKTARWFEGAFGRPFRYLGVLNDSPKFERAEQWFFLPKWPNQHECTYKPLDKHMKQCMPMKYPSLSGNNRDCPEVWAKSMKSPHMSITFNAVLKYPFKQLKKKRLRLFGLNEEHPLGALRIRLAGPVKSPYIWLTIRINGRSLSWTAWIGSLHPVESPLHISILSMIDRQYGGFAMECIC